MNKSNLITATFFFFTLNLSFAQVVWTGGTPGRTNDWNVATNWDTNRIPDEFDDVLIPNLAGQGNFYPIIKTHVPSIQYLFIESNARLEIAENGMLTIDGSNTWNDGLLNFGSLKISGEIDFINVAGETIINEGNGEIFNNRPTSIAVNF